MKKIYLYLTLFTGMTTLAGCDFLRGPDEFANNSDTVSMTGTGGTNTGGTKTGSTGTPPPAPPPLPDIIVENCADLSDCKIEIEGETVDLHEQSVNPDTSKYQIRADRSYAGIYVKDNHYIDSYTAGIETPTASMPTTNDEELTYEGSFKSFVFSWATDPDDADGYSEKLAQEGPTNVGTAVVKVNLSEVGVENAMKFTFKTPTKIYDELEGTFQADGSFIFGFGTSKGHFYGPHAEEMSGAERENGSAVIFSVKKQP